MNDTLELGNITRQRNGYPPVFENLNLSVRQGELLCLLGPSGCGKTTLLRAAASLDEIQSGEIRVNGTRVSGPSPDRLLILQDQAQLFPWLTAIENVAFPLMHSKISVRKKSALKTAGKLLENVGLEAAATLFPAQLSGGMRQRVVLARTVAVNPRILLLDEPFGALDTDTRIRLHTLLLTIHRSRPFSILMVTHDVNEALFLADRIVLMNSYGKLGPVEPNPAGNPRDGESFEFFQAASALRKRFSSLT